MKHSREDYNRIQDPENKIPEDEPVFLMRAQDPCAPVTLAMWADMAEKLNADPALVKGARDTVAAMLAWQRVHGFKVPDGDKKRLMSRTNLSARDIAKQASNGASKADDPIPA